MPNANMGQVPSPAPAPTPEHMRKVWFTLIAVIVTGIALVTGIELARSNSDIICTRTFQDSGSCTNGSWGAWSLSSQSSDQNSCTTSYSESRTYTGTRNTISSNISVRANAHTHCNLSDDAFRGGTGTIISQYAACQIRESRTRVVGGTGAGPSCHLPTNYNPNSNTGTTTSDTNEETEGAVDETRSETLQGTYQLYLDMIDARLATSSIRAIPALLHAGETTRVTWSSDHVKSCTVVGTNGDSWPKPVTVTKTVTNPNDGSDRTAAGTQTNQAGETTETTTEMPAGKTGDEVSSPINQQTIYTLTCKTALGNSLVSSVTVNLIPQFQEI